MSLIQIRTRQVSHQTTPLTVQQPGAQPWNLETDRGLYHACFIRDGAVVIQSSHHGGPPFWLDTVTAATDASHPRLARDTTQRLWLVYESGGDTLRCCSDDGGETWGDPAVAISGGAKPTIAVGHDGTIIVAAVVGTAITASSRGPGDADWGTPFNFQGWNGAANVDLVVKDDTFHLEQEWGPQARWWLHVGISGESATSHWWSGDGGETWTRWEEA